MASYLCRGFTKSSLQSGARASENDNLFIVTNKLILPCELNLFTFLKIMFANSRLCLNKFCSNRKSLTWNKLLSISPYS